MKPCQILLYEPVIEGDAKRFVDEIRAAGSKPIELRINSPGGSVFDGYAIYNALLAHAAGVTVFIDGMACSIASYIAMAGRPLIMAENAMMMIHNPTQFIGGDAEDMRRSADLLQKVTDSIVVAYARRSNQPPEKIAAMMDEETWLTAEMAKELGFIDEISSPMKMAAHFDMSRFRNVPKALLKNESTMNLKNIVPVLVALGQTNLTDASPAEEVEKSIIAELEDHKDFVSEINDFARSVIAKLTAALLGQVTLGEKSTPKEIESAVTAVITDRDGLKIKVVDLSRERDAANTKITDLNSQLSTLNTQVSGLTTERDEAKKTTGLIEAFLISKGFNLQGVLKSKAAPQIEGGPGEGDDAALYDRFKAADPTESARMWADPKIQPRLQAESLRRIKASA